MNNSNLLSLAVVSALVVGCSAPPPPPPPPPVDMDAITKNVQAMEDAYATATINKDAAAVVEYYADDVVSYSKEEPPIKGKEAMRQRLADRMAKDTLNFTPTYKVVDLFMGTDHMTEIGSWTDTDASGTVVDEGTYFSIFEKRGDSWLCIRDIAVSHTPKKKAEEAAE